MQEEHPLDLKKLEEKIREHVKFAVIQSYRESEIKVKLARQLRALKTNSLKKHSIS